MVSYKVSVAGCRIGIRSYLLQHGFRSTIVSYPSHHEQSLA